MTNEKYLAFVDLLGFGKMVERNHKNARKVLNDFYNVAYSTIKHNKEITGHLFSDSLIAYSEIGPSLVNSISKIYRNCLRKNLEYPPGEEIFLLLRGCISRGFVSIEKRNEAPNLNKNFIVSPALVHSASMEKKIKGSRLLVAMNSNAQDIRWSKEINGVLYDEKRYPFWKNFEYADFLWFRDFSKTRDEQKIEVADLIKVAIKLVDQNRNLKYLDQYIETLRIGLLSYCQLCTLAFGDAVLDEVLKKYRAERFWKLWMAIVEMGMQNEDNWALSSYPQFIGFYKQVSITKGWANLLNEINKPEYDYLKGLFTTLLREMNISTRSEHEN